MDASNLRTKRVTLEVRYVPFLGYSRLREELFDKWAEDFTTIGLSDQSIEIVDEKLMFKIFSEWNRSGLYFENVRESNGYMKKTSEYLTKLLNHYKRKDLTRIGNRFQFILPYKNSFEKLLRIVKTNIYKEKVDLLGDIVDVGIFALTAKQDDRKIRISVGPVKKHEIVQQNKFEYGDDPEVALLLDIDYYSDAKKEYDLEKFMQDAWRFVFTRSKQFIQNISEVG